MIRRALLIVTLALPLFGVEAQAQAGARRRERNAGVNPPPRQQLEARLRQGLWRITKQRVGLDDAQMTRLTQTSQRFDARRRTLAQDERQQRLALRTEILAGNDANQSRVSDALDRLLALQRQRIDLQIEEQRELAAFMTPLQRARYAALQEQVRRRVENLRRQRADSTAGTGVADAP
jgi:periplasmic protein CpxP/Spy